MINIQQEKIIIEKKKAKMNKFPNNIYFITNDKFHIVLKDLKLIN